MTETDAADLPLGRGTAAKEKLKPLLTAVAVFVLCASSSKILMSDIHTSSVIGRKELWMKWAGVRRVLGTYVSTQDIPENDDSNKDLQVTTTKTLTNRQPRI